MLRELVDNEHPDKNLAVAAEMVRIATGCFLYAQRFYDLYGNALLPNVRSEHKLVFENGIKSVHAFLDEIDAIHTYRASSSLSRQTIMLVVMTAVLIGLTGVTIILGLTT